MTDIMKTIPQYNTLTKLMYRLSFTDRLSVLHLTAFDPEANLDVLSIAVPVPPQKYYYYQALEWVHQPDKTFNREWVPARSYVAGGFKNGKIAKSFRRQVTDRMLHELHRAFPCAVLPDPEDITTVLVNF